MLFSQRCLIVSSPSGGGKTTLAQRLIATDPRLAFAVSACTRSKRPSEQEGIDYYFMSLENFKKRLQNQEFIEHEQVYPSRYYGTLKSEVQRLAAQEKHILFDVDVKGAQRLKAHFGAAACAVFILPPSIEVLQERLCQRNTETSENIQYRLARATQEIQASSSFDQVVENKDIDQAFIELQALAQAFLL